MPEDDPARRSADDSRCGDEIALSQREGLSPRLVGDEGPAERADEYREADVVQAEEEPDDEQQVERRYAVQCAHEPHDHVVPPPPEVARRDPEADPDDERNDRAEDPDEQRDAGAVEQPHDLAAPQLIATKPQRRLIDVRRAVDVQDVMIVVAQAEYVDRKVVCHDVQYG